MTNTAPMADELRRKIIADPDVILDDGDVMRALMAANSSSLGENVVDLRGIAFERLEERLGRLEDAHKGVIAAAYENLSGTNMIHRAILKLLEAPDFDGFLDDLPELATILKVDGVRLVLESNEPSDAPGLSTMSDILKVAEPGYSEFYATMGRGGTVRKVSLRQTAGKDAVFWEGQDKWIGSEACLMLDFGSARMPGMLVFGAEDPHQFSPSQGTDLLAFFAEVFERAMARWLA
jgi:uncharacterized protein